SPARAPRLRAPRTSTRRDSAERHPDHDPHPSPPASPADPDPNPQEKRMTTTTTYPVGSLVTIKGHGSEVFEITELWTDEEDGTACAYLDSNLVFGEDAAVADLTLVMTAEKAAARRLPTPEEFAKENDWLNLSWGQDFEINGSDQEGNGR